MDKVGSPRIIPVYLSMKNPLMIDFKGSKKADDFYDEIEEAKQKGNDGVIIKRHDLISIKGEDQYIAFSPTQIKSAIGNRGTFDPNESQYLPILLNPVNQKKNF